MCGTLYGSPEGLLRVTVEPPTDGWAVVLLFSEVSEAMDTLLDDVSLKPIKQELHTCKM